MSSTGPTRAIPLQLLLDVWDGLTAIANNYEVGGEGWRSLVEARRLTEVEVRMQHGDGVWEREMEARHS